MSFPSSPVGLLGNPVGGGAVFTMRSTGGWRACPTRGVDSERSTLVNSFADMPSTFLMELSWASYPLLGNKPPLNPEV